MEFANSLVGVGRDDVNRRVTRGVRPFVATGGAAFIADPVGGVRLPNKWRPRRLLITSATLNSYRSHDEVAEIALMNSTP